MVLVLGQQRFYEKGFSICGSIRIKGPNKSDTKWKVTFDWSMCCNTNWKQKTQLES